MRGFYSLFVLGCLISLAAAKKGQKKHDKVFHMATDESECGSVARNEWLTGSPAESCQAVGDEICFCVSRTEGESWNHKCGTCKFGLEMDNNPAERRQRKKARGIKAAVKQEKKKLKKQLKKQMKKQQQKKEKKQERKQERRQKRIERRNQKKNNSSDESLSNDVSDNNQVTVDEVAVE